MGEKSIGGKLIILAMVILIIAFIFCLFYESIFYKSRYIKINYVCELPISSNMDNIVLLKDPFPRLRCISVLEFEKLIGEILDTS